MQNWLASVGFPVRASQFQYAEDPAITGGFATPGAVYAGHGQRGALNSVAARWGKRGALTESQVEALRILMHENLHQMRYGRGDGQVDRFEEGATEAVTQDLLPIFTAKMYGMRIPPNAIRTALGGVDYPGQARNVRQLSTFGSGAKTYQDRKARVWRRTFLHADSDERLRMADAAMGARVEWGKRK